MKVSRGYVRENERVDKSPEAVYETEDNAYEELW